MDIFQKPDSTSVGCDVGASCSSCVLHKRKWGLQKGKNAQDSAGSSGCCSRGTEEAAGQCQVRLWGSAKEHTDQRGKTEEKETHIRAGSWLGPPADDSSYLLSNWSMSFGFDGKLLTTTPRSFAPASAVNVIYVWKTTWICLTSLIN